MNHIARLTFLLCTISGSLNTFAAGSITDRLDAHVKAYFKRGLFSGSVLVAKSGNVLLSRGYGKSDYAQGTPNTPHTKFRLGSVSKQFTALAIMQLQEQGRLNESNPLSTYIPDYPNGKNITIHHLLTHTSGIPNYTSLAHCEKNKAQPRSITRLISTFKNKKLEFKPGSQYKYSNSGYVLLTYIIEQVSGESYESFIQKHIFWPLRMTSSGYDANQQQIQDKACGYVVKQHHLTYADPVDMSYYAGAGALYSTVEDLYRWDRALHSNVLVSYTALDKIFTPWVHTPAYNQTNESAYGYGWRIGKPCQHPVVGHCGGIEGFSTLIRRYPKDDACIIILSNIRNSTVQRLSQDLAKIVLGQHTIVSIPAKKQPCKACAKRKKRKPCCLKSHQ